ncbi:MAG: hypothetical protein ACYCO3_14550 [Mycobacteriales bacterium]
MPRLHSEALDFRAASESFAAVRKLRRADLETLHLVTDHPGRTVPTVGGVLLFGRDRGRHFPDAWIQAGRFAGVDKSRIIDCAEIRSYPVQSVEETIAFVRKHLRQGVEIGPVRRTDRWNLPPVAVREAVINAVVHADYAQRGARSESPSSTIAWRWRAQDYFPSGSPSRIFSVGSRNSATASSAACSTNSD